MNFHFSCFIALEIFCKGTRFLLCHLFLSSFYRTLVQHVLLLFCSLSRAYSNDCNDQHLASFATHRSTCSVHTIAIFRKCPSRLRLIISTHFLCSFQRMRFPSCLSTRRRNFLSFDQHHQIRLRIIFNFILCPLLDIKQASKTCSG